MSEIELAILKWLGEMDDDHVTTGLLARAFEAGWRACEAVRERESNRV